MTPASEQQASALALDRGIALIVVVLATLLMSAIGAALVVNTSSETLITGNFRRAAQTQYAADAALELAVSELADASWDLALSGAARSSFVDGPSSGDRRLGNGVEVNLTRILNRANCQKLTTCSDSDMNAVTSERPWGFKNPRWTFYAHGPVNALSAELHNPCCYIAAMVADDTSDNDLNPWMDGSEPTNPGAGVLVVRAEAFGPRRAHAVRTATISRKGGRLRILSWRNGPVP
jgi:hypothetical protein